VFELGDLVENFSHWNLAAAHGEDAGRLTRI
jgi:hypothetical protein